MTRLVKEKPLGTASGIAVVILILVAVLADVIAPYPYGERHLPDRLRGSSAQYPLGTDHLGRDLLSRIIHGARVSLTVGLAATTLNVLVAVLIGGTSGFLGGRLDLVVQRFVDAWMSFPGLLLLLTIIAIVGQGLVQLIAVLGISSGIVGSRVLRSFPPARGRRGHGRNSGSFLRSFPPARGRRGHGRNWGSFSGALSSMSRRMTIFSPRGRLAPRSGS